MKLYKLRRGRRLWWLGTGVLVTRLLRLQGKFSIGGREGFEVLR